jgi:hypothetical protein
VLDHRVDFLHRVCAGWRHLLFDHRKGGLHHYPTGIMSFESLNPRITAITVKGEVLDESYLVSLDLPVIGNLKATITN